MKLLTRIHASAAVALLSLALPLGCDVGDQTTACDFRATETSLPRCQERSGLMVDGTFESLCGAGKGTFIDAACPTDSRIGGCELDDGSAGRNRVVDWYYAPAAEADVKAQCTDDGVPFVTQ
jgi:hypothetical protein